jgi:hypothetical protein
MAIVLWSLESEGDRRYRRVAPFNVRVIIVSSICHSCRSRGRMVASTSTESKGYDHPIKPHSILLPRYQDLDPPSLFVERIVHLRAPPHRIPSLLKERWRGMHRVARFPQQVVRRLAGEIPGESRWVAGRPQGHGATHRLGSSGQHSLIPFS